MPLLTGIWKIWSFFLLFLSILILAPIVIVLSFSNKTYHSIYFFIRIWAAINFYGIGMRYSVETPRNLEKTNYMIISNHTSFLDIMLMILLHPHHPLTFVGKKSLVKIPLFGLAYKRICVMVDRESASSKSRVYKLATAKIKEGRSMVIFPEGGVTERDEDLLLPFKEGAFAIAKEAQIPILVYTFVGLKKAFPFQFWKGRPMKVLVFLETIINENIVETDSKTQLKYEAEELIYKRLSSNLLE